MTTRRTSSTPCAASSTTMCWTWAPFRWASSSAHTCCPWWSSAGYTCAWSCVSGARAPACACPRSRSVDASGLHAWWWSWSLPSPRSGCQCRWARNSWLNSYSYYTFERSIDLQLILLLKALKMYETNSMFSVILQIVAHTMAYTSSCINPLLYAFLSDNFRKAFYKVSMRHRTTKSHRLLFHWVLSCNQLNCLAVAVHCQTNCIWLHAAVAALDPLCGLFFVQFDKVVSLQLVLFSMQLLKRQSLDAISNVRLIPSNVAVDNTIKLFTLSMDAGQARERWKNQIK